jgi:periplasmic divalent cation tolerance protein
MAEYIQVLTTVSRREEAEQIAQSLVNARLTACVQVSGPITSVYRWRGQVETAQEWQCAAKSRRDLYGEIETLIRRLHSYEVPEILAVALLEGSAQYLAWLDGELKPPSLPSAQNHCR